MGRQVQLELWVVDGLVDFLGLSRSVPPYSLPYIGETVEERAAHRERALEWLAERGYADCGRVADWLEDLLVVWSRPEVLITMDASEFATGNYHVYRSGWSGRMGFHSYQEGESVVLEELRAEQIPGTVVSMLPPAGPFYGNKAVVLTDDPRAARASECEEEFSVADPGRRVTAARPEQGNVEVFFRHEYHRMGLVAISTVRRRGEAPRRLDTLTWADTDNGRYAIVSSPTGDGMLRRSFEPTDGGLISWWIRDRTS